MVFPGAASVSVEHCLEVFAKGVAFTRSHSRDYTASKIHGIWWLRDSPGFGGRARNQEWIAHAQADPKNVDQFAREAAERFLINALATNKEQELDLLSKYRKLGYRLWQRQQLMTRDVRGVPQVEAAAKIRPVDTEEMAARLAKATSERIRWVQLKGGGSIRCHIATVENELVGWVRSVSIDNSSWCASLFVKPEFRRRGIARALVRQMLVADERAGASASVLVATQAGAKVYGTMGYHSIATVMVLTPIR
jgi:GNAT superfamily N-acetyltransferase